MQKQTNNKLLAIAYTNLSAVYQETQNLTQALKQAQKALKVRQKISPITTSNIDQAYQLLGLIYNDLKNYENLAVELGKNKEKYLKLRRKFEERSKNSELFDNVKFTKNLENVYKNLLKN